MDSDINGNSIKMTKLCKALKGVQVDDHFIFAKPKAPAPRGKKARQTPTHVSMNNNKSVNNTDMKMKQCNLCRAECSSACVCKKVFYCSLKCQKQDWSRHKGQCPKYTITLIGDSKGRGLVARRNIQPGDIVLEEKALIRVLVDQRSPDSFRNDVLDSYTNLSDEDQDRYNSLSLIDRAGHDKVLNIWLTNNIQILKTSSDEEFRGIFYNVSHTNHSCAPNTVINFDALGNLVLVAVERINKGEEILINYLDHGRGSQNQDKQMILKDTWGFTCQCRICSLTGQELKRNKSMKEQLIGLINSQKENEKEPLVESAKKRLTLEVAILDLLYKLGAETVREIAECLHRCYLFSKVLEIQGVSLSQSANSFRNAAWDHANFLGDTFVKEFWAWDECFDKEIAEVIKFQVEMRREDYVKHNAAYHLRFELPGIPSSDPYSSEEDDYDEYHDQEDDYDRYGYFKF